MISCILVKNNNIAEIKVKNLDNTNIYKKCGYKQDINFLKINEWKYNGNIIELWSKKENSKNNNLNFIKNINFNVSSKSIFLLRSNEKYISLKYNNFKDFFKIEISEIDPKNELIEADHETNNENNDETYDEINKSNITNFENINIDKKETHINEDDENNSDYSYNSELSYDLYCYSDEED
tara:strand:- start:268 stop:810 length:543 start_codon:yes stop_codon:yes gene_type:complete